MDEKGLPERDILHILKEGKKEDLEYSNGRILSSMCTSPHPLSIKVHKMFAEKNLGDTGLFKGTKELEKETIKILGSLLNHKDATGFITSGGTEGNLMALWVARNVYEKEKPEVIIPKTAHFSFDKAGDILGLKIIKAKLKKDYTLDEEDVSEKVNENTLAIVGIAGSTEYGTIDDIEALSKIALDNNLYLHVDAAFGGLVIPFLHDLGYTKKSFDFSLEGVKSITVDPHKMGLVAIPSGCILFRDEGLLKSIETPSPYLIEKRQHTLTGTRSGASIATTYAVLKHMGREGYRDVVKRCMKRTMKLYNELKGIGMGVIKPTMNILVFSHEAQDKISRGLIEKGWIISRTRKGEVRLVIMPHVKDEMVAKFLKDLKEILRGL